MFWYLMQTFVFCWVVYIYSTKLTPENPPFIIAAFAFMVVFILTVTLNFIFDLLRRLVWWWRGSRLLGNNTLVGQERSHRPRIHIQHKVLPRP